MEVEEFLKQSQSRSTIHTLANEALQDDALFDKLLSLSFSANQPLAWRSAWALTHVCKKQPELFQPYASSIMDFLPEAKFEGVKRCFIYIISSLPLQSYPVPFINLCFDWAFSPRQPVSIQCYCLHILAQVCVLHPDFESELIACLENADPADYSKGFNATRRNILKSLYKG